MLGQIILQIVLIALCALFTYTESAVTEMNDSRLEKLAAGGDKRAVRLKKLTNRPARFLSAVRTAFAAAGAASSAAAVYFFTEPLADALSGAVSGLSITASENVAVVIIVLLLVFVITVFGRLIPKSAAEKEPEKKALLLSGTASAVSVIFAPMVWLSRLTAGGILRIMGIDPSADTDTVTEEEILMMSDAGAEKGTIDEDENRIIKNVFAFDDMTAGQICTHRTDVSVLWSNDDISAWEEVIHRTRHSVFPICGESVDNVVGILDAKDYFRLDDKSRENIMECAVREPCFVHENMKADRLFEQMKQSGADHFAVVVDEYGGMSGIITITDLVEQLVGDFDEDPEHEPAVRLSHNEDGTWTVPGIITLAELNNELELELPEDKYDTFGGYVIAELGEIPKDGSQVSIDIGTLHVDVLEVRHHRIEACRVDIAEEESEKE